MNTHIDNGRMQDGHNMGGQPKISDDYTVVVTFNAAAQAEEVLPTQLQLLKNILTENFKRSAQQVAEHIDELELLGRSTIHVQQYHEALDLIALANARVDKNCPRARKPDHMHFSLL